MLYGINAIPISNNNAPLEPPNFCSDSNIPGVMVSATTAARPVRLVKLLIKGKGGWRGGRAKMLMKDKCGFGCLGYATKFSQREGLKKQKGCLIIVEMLEEEWKRRRIVKFNVKKRLENKINDMDENEDLLEEEEVEESDSDPESSCYEDYNEGEEEDV